MEGQCSTPTRLLNSVDEFGDVPDCPRMVFDACCHRRGNTLAETSVRSCEAVVHVVEADCVGRGSLTFKLTHYRQKVPVMTGDYTILRVGNRLAIVTPLGQFFYLTSEPEDGIALSLQHRHDVLMEDTEGANGLERTVTGKWFRDSHTSSGGHRMCVSTRGPPVPVTTIQPVSPQQPPATPDSPPVSMV